MLLQWSATFATVVKSQKKKKKKFKLYSPKQCQMGKLRIFRVDWLQLWFSCQQGRSTEPELKQSELKKKLLDISGCSVEIILFGDKLNQQNNIFDDQQTIKSIFLQYLIISYSMKKLRHLKKIDTKPSTLTLSFNNLSAYQTKTGGLLSLTAYSLILFIIVYKIYDVIQGNHVQVDKEVSMTDYNTPINISDMVFALHLEARTRLGTVQINSENQFQFGINVTLQYNYQYQKDGNHHKIGVRYKMNSSRDNFFIIRNTPGIDNELLGRIDLFNPNQGDGDLYKRLAIRIFLCDEDVDNSCQPYESNIFAFLIFRNRKINPYTTDKQQILKFDPAYRVSTFITQLNKLETVSLTYFFKGVNISTDYSIWPEIVHQEDKDKDNKFSWIYDNQYTQDIYYIGQDNDELLKLCLKRSEYTILYKRSFKKFDTAFAEIFGLIGLIFLVKNLILQGYNDWSFQRMRLKLMRNKSDGKEQSLNICKYYWENLRKIANCLSCNKKQQNAVNEDYLDYYYLLKRMENIQEILMKHRPLDSDKTTKIHRQEQQQSSQLRQSRQIKDKRQKQDIGQLSQNLLQEQVSIQEYEKNRISIN